MSLSPQFGSIVPSPIQQTLASNYLVFDGAAGGNFAQQYLPEIYEQEVERYGNRTLSGFLRMVGAEMPMTSDQVIWSEQNRLHISYDGCGVAAGGGAGVGLASVVTLPVAAGSVVNVISINDTVVVFDRVRENLRKYKSWDQTKILNKSLNETLSRTVMTSVTTSLALLAIIIFGGAVLRDFALAMLWGVTVGTYSSIFVAVGVISRFDLKRSDDEDNSAPVPEYER